MSRNELYRNVQEILSRMNGLILALDDEQLSSQAIFALEIVLPGSPQLILSNHLQKKMPGSSLKSFRLSITNLVVLVTTSHMAGLHIELEKTFTWVLDFQLVQNTVVVSADQSYTDTIQDLVSTNRIKQTKWPMFLETMDWNLNHMPLGKCKGKGIVTPKNPNISKTYAKLSSSDMLPPWWSDKSLLYTISYKHHTSIQ